MFAKFLTSKSSRLRSKPVQSPPARLAATSYIRCRRRGNEGSITFATRSKALRDLTFFALTRSWSTTRIVPAITAKAPIVRRIVSISVTVECSFVGSARSIAPSCWAGGNGLSGCGCDSAAAHDLADCHEIGRAAGRGIEDGRNFTKVVGAEDAGRHDRECLRVDVACVVELVDGASGDAERFSFADLACDAVDCPGQGACESVDRLLIAVVAVCGRELRAGGNVELEDCHRPCRLLAFDEERDCHRADSDLLVGAGCHRDLLPRMVKSLDVI